MRHHNTYLVLGFVVALAMIETSALAQNYAITGSSRVITQNTVLSGSSGGIELYTDGGKVFTSSSYTGAGSTSADQGEAITLTISQIAGPPGQLGYSQFTLVASGSESNNGLDQSMGEDKVVWNYSNLSSGQQYADFTINTTYPSSSTWYQNFSAATTLEVDIEAWSLANGGSGEDGSASASASATATVAVK